MGTKRLNVVEFGDGSKSRQMVWCTRSLPTRPLRSLSCTGFPGSNQIMSRFEEGERSKKGVTYCFRIIVVYIL